MQTLTRQLDAALCKLPQGVSLAWPGGRAGDPGAAVRVVLRHTGQLRRLLRGQIGDLAEDYVRGDLEIDGRPADVMAVAGALAGDPVQQGQVSAPQRWLGRLRSLWLHRIGRDAEQVRAHYDAGDAFFALWLDPLRVYSCAYFASPHATLTQAQETKLERICEKLGLRAGQHLLDIGAGWGGLAIWAARHHDVRVTGITVSRNQFDHLRRLVDALGLRGRVEVRLQDYREVDADQGFDRIASIGMFEHVGAARLPDYFARLHGLLRPGGLLLNHGIAAGGVHNPALGAGLGRFVERRIFPGGELVHVSAATSALAAGGLELLDAENLRPHYVRTLWAWSDALEARLHEARLLTDESTVRAYRLYLAGAAMCFDRGWLSLYQLLAGRQAPAGNCGALRCDHPYLRALAHDSAPAT